MMKSLEDVLAFKQIMKYMTDEQKTNIVKAMGISLEEIDRRMEGKRKEDEFILILLFMDVCKSLSGFDESISKLGDKTYTPDLIVELKSGKKFLLEIKSTKEKQYKISQGNLAKKMAYAKSLGLDLYFAIYLYNMWLLYPADYIKSNNGKIELEDITKSYLDEIFDTFSYMFPPKLKIKSVYSKNTNKGIGINYDNYGELISYELFYDDKKIFRIKGKNSPIIAYSMILEALQDRLANVKQKIIESGDITVIFDYDDSENYNMISEYEFLLAPVMHTSNPDTGVKNTAETVMADLKSDIKIGKFQLGHYRGMMSKLVSLGVPMLYIRDGKIYKVPNESI